jgi:hypothetical protein
MAEDVEGLIGKLRAEADDWRGERVGHELMRALGPKATATAAALDELVDDATQVCGLLTEAADVIERQAELIAALEQRSLENTMLAHGWMVAHDQLLGFIQERPDALRDLIANGPRRDYPSPADVPNALARIAALEAALERIRERWLEGKWRIAHPKNTVKSTEVFVSEWDLEWLNGVLGRSQEGGEHG